MSTYLHLACLDHTPIVFADQESTQHAMNTGVIDQIRTWVADRDNLIAFADHIWDGSDYYLKNTLRFLLAHPHCRISSRTEYGEWIDVGHGVPELEPLEPREARVNTLVRDVASALSDTYDGPGMLIFWSSPITYLDGKRPCDVYRDRDVALMERLAQRTNATADGNF